MSVEFIGFITNNNSSETIVRTGTVLDRHYIETVAKAHETAGFDRALLAFHSTIPDALQVGQHVVAVQGAHGVLLQAPGPVVAAHDDHRQPVPDQRVRVHQREAGRAVAQQQEDLRGRPGQPGRDRVPQPRAQAPERPRVQPPARPRGLDLHPDVEHVRQLRQR